jgi:hypothetical protein
MADEDEDDKKFEERFNKLFHKAMGDRDKRSEKKLAKTLDDFGTKLLEKITKKPEGTSDEDPDEVDEDPDETPPEPTPKAKKAGRELAASKGAKLSQEQEARLKKAEKDASDAKARADKLEADKIKAENAALRSEERQKILSKVTGKVKPSLLDMVVDKLHKSVIRDEETEGKPMLYKTGKGDEALPFDDGIDAWLKSDEAKEVAPPKDVRGAGSRDPANGVLPGQKGGEITAEQVGQIVLASIPR